MSLPVLQGRADEATADATSFIPFAKRGRSETLRASPCESNGAVWNVRNGIDSTDGGGGDGSPLDGTGILRRRNAMSTAHVAAQDDDTTDIFYNAPYDCNGKNSNNERVAEARCAENETDANRIAVTGKSTEGPLDRYGQLRLRYVLRKRMGQAGELGPNDPLILQPTSIGSGIDAGFLEVCSIPRYDSEGELRRSLRGAQ